MWPESEKTKSCFAMLPMETLRLSTVCWIGIATPCEKWCRIRLDRAIARRVDASDVVQDVLLEASGRLDDDIADPRMPFHLWLRQLAQDRMINLHQRHCGA